MKIEITERQCALLSEALKTEKEKIAETISMHESVVDSLRQDLTDQMELMHMLWDAVRAKDAQADAQETEAETQPVGICTDDMACNTPMEELLQENSEGKYPAKNKNAVVKLKEKKRKNLEYVRAHMNAQSVPMMAKELGVSEGTVWRYIDECGGQKND